MSTPPSPTPPITTAPWRDLLRGQNGLRALALTGGVALHAVNVHIVTTVLPSVVADIGGLDWYAWNTTLFVVASIVGAALSVRLLAAWGPRGACMVALALFAAGSAGCALAPSMPWMLASRSVQGGGGGMLAALGYALIRLVFAPPLWPRAVALVSGMWGVATLCGPAVGGVFAQGGHWRWAFWTLLPVALLQAVLVAVQLRPARLATAAVAGIPRIPGLQIALLVASVLAVAAGSVAAQGVWQAVGAGAGLALGALALAWERRAARRGLPMVLPTGGALPGTPLGAVYLCLALLLVGTTTEIFVPYFLQTLQGLTPLAAGYLTAAMAGGWSLGSVLSSGHQGARAGQMLRSGPLWCAASLLALAVLVPLDRGPDLGLAWYAALCALALAGVGAGVGMGWPHLLTRVLTLAPPGQEDVASAAITTVQLYGMAVGAAAAGLVVNAAGLAHPGGRADGAAVWLFASFALAPLAAAWWVRRVAQPVAVQK